MSDEQKRLIELCRSGVRIKTEYSLFDEEINSIDCNHPWWRDIACDGDYDVVECSKCGRQKVTKCNFDDEYN